MLVLEQFPECLLLLPGCRWMNGLSKQPLALPAGSRPPHLLLCSQRNLCEMQP